jgi:hypothetical protein
VVELQVSARKARNAYLLVVQEAVTSAEISTINCCHRHVLLRLLVVVVTEVLVLLEYRQAVRAGGDKLLERDKA